MFRDTFSAIGLYAYSAGKEDTHPNFPLLSMHSASRSHCFWRLDVGTPFHFSEPKYVHDRYGYYEL